MEKNPMVKPRVATTALVTASIAVVVILVLVIVLVTLVSLPLGPALFIEAFAIVLLAVVAPQWFMAIRRRNRWTEAANQQWARIAELKTSVRAATEITVMDFLDIQPTGSWVKIRWEKFGYIQNAWIENNDFDIWSGSVLLIAPDPAQITVGAPWPATYTLRASQCLAIAPLASIT